MGDSANMAVASQPGSCPTAAASLSAEAAACERSHRPTASAAATEGHALAWLPAKADHTTCARHGTRT
jgi:hypothetical protein